MRSPRRDFRSAQDSRRMRTARMAALNATVWLELRSTLQSSILKKVKDELEHLQLESIKILRLR